MRADRYPEKFVCITGAGQSEVGRPSAKSPLALTVDACPRAIAAAGLQPADIDGLTTFPGVIGEASGFAPIGATEAVVALGLDPVWVGASTEGHAHMSAIFSAIMAIASGLCRHVLVFRSIAQGGVGKAARESNLMSAAGAASRISGRAAWTVPFNALSPANICALYAQAYFDKYGATSQQLGAIAVHSRRMAALNPNAIFRKPMTLDDYMSSRLISAPLRLLDCDVPIDGSTAILLSHRDAARNLARPPIEIESMGMAHRGTLMNLHQGDFASTPADRAGEMLWSRTDLKPADVDVAQLYDGFSIMTLFWLESLKLCGRGEAAAFVEGGTRIGLDGALPLNTSGGQLSQGRFHGYGQTYEACLQLWDLAGKRQVKGARVCAVSNGAFGYGTLLLRRG